MKRARGSRFRDNDSGAVAPTIALSLFGLIAVGGIGFDYARMAAMDSELQNAADQAALAAATQLDGETDARARATTAAQSLVSNTTLFANDAVGTAVDVPTANVVFYVDKAKSTVATTDADANFVEVTTATREANFALTPIVAALSSGPLEAIAFAGVDSAICKVPPMMICSPDPSDPFNALGKVGWGIQVTGKGSTSWGPGDFGFLEVGDGQPADLQIALAFGTTTYDCTPIEGTAPQTGNAQGLFRAINTRFDIYDTSGIPLGNCQSSDCPPALNVLKDLVKPNDNNTGNNACRPHGSGWQLPPTDRQFWPKDKVGTSGASMEQINDLTHSPSIDAMGLPRDNCHYASFNSACGNDTDNKFGDGKWARGDYFNRYHSGRIPASAGSMTRYQTYRWELDEGHVATINGTAAGSNFQYSAPVCSGLSAGGVDRRVLSVAVVKNCAALSGASVDVEVDEWVDMFLVEPVFDARGNGSVADSIYMEIIGPSSLGGLSGASGPQTIRKDVPYLIE